MKAGGQHIRRPSFDPAAVSHFLNRKIPKIGEAEQSETPAAQWGQSVVQNPS